MSLIHEALEKKLTRPFSVKEKDRARKEQDLDALFETAESKRTFFLKEVQWVLYGMVVALIFLTALYFFAIPLYNKNVNRTKIGPMQQKIVKENPVVVNPSLEQAASATVQDPPISIQNPTSQSVAASRGLASGSSMNLENIFSLTGITRDMKEWNAIINNRLVRVGDKVSGAKVSFINEEEVGLDYQGQTITLTLHS